MTHKAKIGDTVLSRITGKRYEVSGFKANGIIVESDFGTGLLFENEYEVVKKAEPDMFVVTRRDLRAGSVLEMMIMSAEAVEKRLNGPNANDLTVYKLVPVEIKEVDVTVKKKVIV